MAIIYGTTGPDTKNGTEGQDTIYGWAKGSNVNSPSGNDTLNGASGNDNLNGGTGNDSLIGGEGLDTLNGQAGNDTLNGGLDSDNQGEGNDLNGGAGNDTYIVNSGDYNTHIFASDTITEAANSGTDTVRSAISYTLQGNLEILTLTGTRTGNSGTGNDLNNTITGNAANNTLNGAAGNDILNAAAGSDTLNGGLGSDTLNGGTGNDTYIIDSTSDTITEAANSGTDTVQSSVSYTLGSNLENLKLTETTSNGTGNSFNNIIVGNTANNILLGGAGNDTLDGEAGNDKLNGGAGNDTFLVSSESVGQRDTLTGSAGIDTFFLGNANQVFYDDRNTSNAGTGDYALITDFKTSEDIIKLNGAKNNYFLALSPSGLPAGTAIYRDKPSSEKDELIAIVQGSSSLVLNGNYFSFTGSSSLNLSDLNGSNGFLLNGIDAGDRSGFSVSSAGDVNGDGFDDLLIGAPLANPTPGEYGELKPAGETYVVFGKAAGFGASFNVSGFDGSNGFVFKSNVSQGFRSGSNFGYSVSSAGDINGDGFDDLIVGAPAVKIHSDLAGVSYIMFGKGGGFDASLTTSDLDGSNGFVISGDRLAGYSGTSVSSAGDFNGDGYDDLLIGGRDLIRYSSGGTGTSYVVFGKAEGFGGRFFYLSELNGSNGFRIEGLEQLDLLGISVSSAGDVNGDGFDDILIGSPTTNAYSQYNLPKIRNDPGYSYVVFGKAGGFDASFNLSELNGSNGFRIDGINGNDGSGRSVSKAGDVNGDGFDDIIIGANLADPNSQDSAGESYVVFGKAGGNGSRVNLSSLNGSNGFAINGIDAGDQAGISVSAAGDVNGDGLDDLLIEAPYADPNGQNSAGESYVVFGRAGGFGASLNLSDLNGSNGFAINGIDAGDSTGLGDTYLFFSDPVSSAGDVNGDGFDDLIIGAPGANPNGQNSAGESYVIFGRNFTASVTHAGTTGNDTLIGTAGDDILIGDQGNDSLIGGRGSNVLKGGSGNDTLSFGAIDRRIDGGSGTDTLRIDISGVNLDLTTISNNKITQFERIDLTGTGNNSLTFTRLDVLDLSDTTNQLIVNGNAGDAVTSIQQGWTAGGTTTVDGILYDRYTIGAAALLVHTDIIQTIT